jgi:hypothetical protein
MGKVLVGYSLLVIPDAEPTGPAFGRPDDRLHEAIRNLSPAPINRVQKQRIDSGLALARAPK